MGNTYFPQARSPVSFYKDTLDDLWHPGCVYPKDHPSAQSHLTSLPGVGGGDEPHELLLGNPCSRQPALSHVPSHQVTAEWPQGHWGRHARSRPPHLWRPPPNLCLGPSSLGKNGSTFCMVENSAGSPSREMFAAHVSMHGPLP